MASHYIYKSLVWTIRQSGFNVKFSFKLPTKQFKSAARQTMQNDLKVSNLYLCLIPKNINVSERSNQCRLMLKARAGHLQVQVLNVRLSMELVKERECVRLWRHRRRDVFQVCVHLQDFIICFDQCRRDYFEGRSTKMEIVYLYMGAYEIGGM